MKRLLLIGLLFWIIRTCLGQELELLGIEYGNYSNAKVKTADSLEASFTEYEFNALFPAIAKEKFSLLTGGTYRLVMPNSDERLSESNLFFLALRLIGAYNLSENEKLLISAIPAISTTTNSSGFTSDNFLMQGGIFYQKKVSDKFSYTLGLLSTSRFGSPLVLPTVGLTNKGRKMKLDVNLPVLIQSTWNYKSAFSYGLKLSVNGSQYNFEDESFNGSQVDLARFSRIRMGPEIQYRIKGAMVFTLYGGVAANRTYDFELDTGSEVDLGLENGPFVAVRFALKPQIKNK